MQQSSSKAPLDLAEAGPVQNATDCSPSLEAATASDIQVQHFAAGKVQHSGHCAAANQGCTFELGSSASVSAAAVEEAAERRGCNNLLDSSASLSTAAAEAAEPMQGADSQPCSSGSVSTATQFGLTAISEMVRDTINATQSSETVSLGGDGLDDDDAYEYPFGSQIRWLKDTAARCLGVGGTAQVFRLQTNYPCRLRALPFETVCDPLLLAFVALEANFLLPLTASFSLWTLPFVHQMLPMAFWCIISG